ncbi:hypothetical protein DNU06_14770 [Putridiphycobacter roseus]|uniref:Uncharacterized protein n=1 Tax=Putridiphycobacter roseus TaxID=2219161 RepID=A0A2W1MZM4_9FLAO|nr:hypothetical protein [Putridiphycobacter roseus]PZE16061.1 hypothetical protein DNU06_14770 [Putridiphycobacter roseus]
MSIKKVPGWGKTVGILMIIMGSLGAFYQLYRIVFPMILNVQQEFIGNFSRITKDQIQNNDSLRLNPTFNENFESFENSLEAVNNTIFKIEPHIIQYIMVFSLIMLLVNVIYIIAGTKLLTKKIANYQFAKITLIIAILINVLSLFLIFSGNNSLMIFAMMFYAFIGLIADIVYIIILQSHDQSEYDENENAQKQVISIEEGFEI